MGQKGTFKVNGIPVRTDKPTRGNSYYVCNATAVSTDSTGADDISSYGTITRPFATVDYAVGQCTANQGDEIHVLQNHAETISAAGGITCDVAGVSIICHGVGDDRPTFTFSGTAASIVYSAANVKMVNFIGVPSIDSVTNPLHVQAADVELDVEWRDASSTVEAVRAVLTTDAADRFKLNLKYVGDVGGNACVNAVRLVGCATGDINIDFYGVASTGVVEFITTASTDINIRGYMYNSGTTDGSKNVINTGGLSNTWYAEIEDGAAGAKFSGGSASTLASDDITAVNSVLGLVSTAAATGAVTATDNIMAYVKQLITQNGIELDTDTLGALLAGASGIATMPNAAVPANNVNAFELLRSIWGNLCGTAAGENGITTFPSAAAAGNSVSIAEVIRYIQETQIGTLTNTGGTATLGGLIGDLANVSMRQRTSRGIVKSVASIATSNLFTVSGGMVKIVNIVGYITTAIQAQANNVKLIMTPTGGTATDICAVLDLNAAGQYGLLTTTGTFANALALTATAGVKAGVQAAPFITSPGVLSMNCSATNTGAIDWYIEYVPMDEDATITAA